MMLGNPSRFHMRCAICFQNFIKRDACLLGSLHDLPLRSLTQDGESSTHESEMFTDDFTAHVLMGEYLFTFDGANFTRRHEYVLDPDDIPRPSQGFETNTRSGKPIFAFCRVCFNVIPYFLRFRRYHYRRRISNAVWFELDDVYKSLELELETTSGHKVSSKDRPRVDGSGRFPRPIPSLPEYILSKLQLVPQDPAPVHHGVPLKEREASLHSSALQRLPFEVLDMIVERLDAQSCFAMRRTCSSISHAIQLDQRFWYRQVMNKSLFGFFFDFEIMKTTEEIQRKSKKQGKLPPKWDWKQIAGQLGKLSSFQESGGPLNDAPGDFIYDRSIWAIMEYMEKLPLQRNASEPSGSGATQGTTALALEVQA